jgi:hypothetical protein
MSHHLCTINPSIYKMGFLTFVVVLVGLFEITTNAYPVNLVWQ